MIKKPKIGFFSFTSCEGCQFVLLDLGKKFFDFLKKVELVDMSLIEEQPFPEGKISLDVAFVEGNPITKEEIDILYKIREETKILVVLGNCAALGGIPEIKNYRNKEKTIRYIYKHLDKSIKDIANPEIKEIDNFIKVDFVIPGCPINGEEFLLYAKDLIKGKIPTVCQSPVCSECPRRGTKECFLAQKKMCFGLVSLAGCGAVCPRNGLMCRACRGFLKNANLQGLLKVLKSFGFDEEQIKEELEIFGLRDQLEEIRVNKKVNKN